jgi:hypothetical protein
MTKKELSQLYWLKREIADQQRRIEELEGKATSGTAYITGMPRSPNIMDRLADFASEIADLKMLIELNLKKCVHEYNRLRRYINGIEDGYTRQIFTLRFIDDLSWLQVALRVGGNNTSDSVRMVVDRHLSRG